MVKVPVRQIKRTLRFKLAVLGLFLSLVTTVTTLGIILYWQHRQTFDPIPISIRHKVAFNLYYPNSKKLPNGFSLDTSSFSATNEAVIYSVFNKNGQNLAFSIQQKPSASDMQGFYSTYMPLAISLQTNTGSAEIGVINQKTVASLVTKTNAWVLITAPSNISQTQLKEVLQSMEIAS